MGVKLCLCQWMTDNSGLIVQEGVKDSLKTLSTISHAKIFHFHNISLLLLFIECPGPTPPPAPHTRAAVAERQLAGRGAPE